MNRYFNVLMGTGLLFMPAISFAADKKMYQQGSTAAGCLILILVLWGIYKSFSIARRGTTSTQCALSLGFSLICFFLLYGLTVVKPYIASFLFVLPITVVLAGIFLIISMIVAIIGLVEYNQNYTQGKKQAVWAIVLNSVFIILILSGIIIGIAMHANKKNKMYVSEENTAPMMMPDLNFKLDMPGKPYAKIKPQTLNPYAKAALMRGNPQVFYMLIPERIGVDQTMKTEDLLEISQAALKGGTQSLEIGPVSDKLINGMKGLYFVSDARINTKKVTYVHWVCSINGFAYQQIAFSNTKNKKMLIKEAEKLFFEFEQIDPDAVCYSEGSTPLERYESGQFGYSLDLRKTSWLKWSDVSEQIPGADIGGQTGDGVAAFFVSPLSLEQNSLDHDVIIAAFLQSISVDRNNEKLVLLSKHQGISFQDYLFTYQKNQNNSLLDYRIKISVGSDRAFLTAVWTDGKISKVDQFFDQVDTSIQYLKIRHASETKRFDAGGKRVMADILNRVGIIYENRKDYDTAVKYYSLAISYDPADEIFWDNVMKIFNQQKKHKTAVQFFKTYDQEKSLNKNTLAWYAWHLAQSGYKSEALDKYKSLFISGYQNKEDFKYYIRLLAESGNLAAINPAYDGYLKQQENTEMRLHQAQIWYGQKQFDKALAVLEKTDKNSPDIIMEQIYNLQGLERHKESLPLCDRLINLKKYAGDGYYFKGKSEFHLKWYAKAKKSFETSLEYFPGNKTITGYLKELSGILGQGDNSIIKKQIVAVPLPEKVAGRMLKTVDPEHIKGDSAYYLQYCSGYQWGSDGVVKTTLRHKIHIVNSTGANNFSTYSINFNPLYEQLYVNSLLVRDKDGNIIAKGEEDSYFIIDQNNSSLKTHEQTLNIPIPQLSPGCTLEIVATKILGNYEQFPFTERVLSGRYPVINSMVYILGDVDKFNLKTENGVKTESFTGGQMAYVYLPMKYREEPHQLSYRKILPCAYINGKGDDWSKQGESYLEKIKRQLILTDDIKKLALSLTNKKDSEGEKISKLYRYLQQNYKYLGIEFGSRGEIPYDASKTVNNKFGDCKDHAVLFHHLLKSAGIKNYLALVNIDHPVRKDMPSRDQFNHIINYIPGKSGRFIDSTDKNSAVNITVPMELAGSQALILEPGSVRFVKIPDYSKQDSHINVKREFNIKGETLHINEALEMTGYYAAYMRNFLKRKNKDGHNAWGQETVQSYYPSGKLEKIDIINLRENDKPVTVHFFYSVTGRVHAVEKKLVVNTAGIWESYYLFSEPVKSRKTKFQIRLPFIFTSHNVINVPQGFSMSKYPENILPSKTDFGVFDIKFNPDKNKLDYQLKLTAEEGVFPNDKYQEYYQFKQKILQAILPNISLVENI